MESPLNTVAFIPVRGGSKSIPLKNIKEIAGKPLVQWVLEAANDCDAIDRIFVSTDSVLIQETVEKMCIPKVQVISRSERSATDTASSEMPLLEFANSYEFRDVVFIQATSPLLTSTHLNEALHKFNLSSADSMLSVVRQKRFIWTQSDEHTVTPANYDPMNRPRRQEFEGYFVENGAFYITKRENLLQSKCRISGKITHYEMPEESYIELDEPVDWDIVERLLIKRQSRTASENLKRIKMLITDCDGVLTDGGMYYSPTGDELKKFHTRDGMGISLLQQIGIQVAIVTGEDTPIVEQRARKLKIDSLYMGAKDKLAVLHQIMNDHHLKPEEIAYIGDDINDIDVLKFVGFGAAVSNAMQEVKQAARYITKTKGGEGAVRELADMIIAAKRGQSYS